MDFIAENSEADTITAYPITQRVHEGRTATGTDVTIADSPSYGRLLFLDGELQSAQADEHIYHETLVHPAMSHHRARRVLVVGGGEGATVREVLRFPSVERVDWVDYDDELVQLCERFLGWAPGVRQDPRVAYTAADIRDALPRLGDTYDVVILDLPDPDGETGWLYSEDFWNAMKGRVAAGGVLVTHCGPVRPFGDIGAGFQRVRPYLGSFLGFYTMPIPSFQGEWGFWMWTPIQQNPFVAAENGFVTRVATPSQIRMWRDKPSVWCNALAKLA